MYIDTQWVSPLGQYGGECRVLFTAPRSFMLTNEWGTITLDGKSVPNGKNLALQGQDLRISYVAHQANGFEAYVTDGRTYLAWTLKDPTPTAVPTATPIPSPYSMSAISEAYCTINGSRRDIGWDESVVWIPDTVVTALKQNGGDCKVVFVRYTRFTYVSGSGTLDRDGTPLQGTSTLGQVYTSANVFHAVYRAGDQGAGFMLGK